jgi:hypothetical protein
MKRWALLLMIAVFVLAGVTQVFASTMSINATLDITWSYGGSGTIKDLELGNGIYIHGDAQNIPSPTLESYNPSPFWQPNYTSYDGTWLKNISGTNSISGAFSNYDMSRFLSMEAVGPPSSGGYFGQIHEQAQSYWYIVGYIDYGSTEPTADDPITISIAYSYAYSLTQDGTNPFVKAKWNAGMTLYTYNSYQPEEFVNTGWIGDNVNPLDNILEGQSGTLEFDIYPEIVWDDVKGKWVSNPYTKIDLYANQYGNSISSISPVPLPGAVWLLGSGVLGLLGLRKFRKS